MASILVIDMRSLKAFRYSTLEGEFMKKMRGSTTLIIVGILIAVSGVYFTISAVSASLQDKTNKISALEKTVTQQVTEIDLLKEDKIRLESQLVLQRELSKIQDDLIIQRDGEIKTLQGTLAQAQRKLPKPVTRASEPIQTDQQVERSTQRITTIWELYCADKLLSDSAPICNEVVK